MLSLIYVGSFVKLMNISELLDILKSSNDNPLLAYEVLITFRDNMR